MLTVNNLSVELSGAKILDGDQLSFVINQGEVVALLGPNGSGKSTLIRTILGLVKKSGGEVKYESGDVGALTAKQRATLFAYVPQNTSFHSAYTVLESVVMGRYPHMKRFERYGEKDYKIAAVALARVGMSGFGNRIVTTLSGGEAARVAIARAITQDSPVLLLDEPISALDPKHALIITDVIREIANEGRIILIAMHDVNLALDSADRMIFLRNGAIFADIKSGNIDENTLQRVYDIPWEIWSTGENRRLVAIPGRGALIPR